MYMQFCERRFIYIIYIKDEQMKAQLCVLGKIVMMNVFQTAVVIVFRVSPTAKVT